MEYLVWIIILGISVQIPTLMSLTFQHSYAIHGHFVRLVAWTNAIVVVVVFEPFAAVFHPEVFFYLFLETETTDRTTCCVYFI